MTTLLSSFIDAYEKFDSCPHEQLMTLYGDNIVFKDPLHTISGKATLSRYFQQMTEDLIKCEFEFTSEIATDNEVFYRWNMHYQHPKLNKGKLLCLEGASMIQYADKITFHQDFYDMGAMLYEHIPALRCVIQLIKQRLTKVGS